MSWSGPTLKIEATMFFGVSTEGVDPQVIVRGVSEETRPGTNDCTFPVITVSESSGLDRFLIFRTLTTDDNSRKIIVSSPESVWPNKTSKTEGVVVDNGFGMNNSQEGIGCIRVNGKNFPKTPSDRVFFTSVDGSRERISTEIFGPEIQNPLQTNLEVAEIKKNTTTGRTGKYWYDVSSERVGYEPLSIKPGNITSCVSTATVSREGVSVKVGELVIPTQEEDAEVVGRINDLGPGGSFNWLNGALTMKHFIPGTDSNPNTTLTLHYCQQEYPPWLAFSVVLGAKSSRNQVGVGVKKELEKEDIKVVLGYSHDCDSLDLHLPPDLDEHRFLVSQEIRQIKVIEQNTSLNCNSQSYVVERGNRWNMEGPFLGVNLTSKKVCLGEQQWCLDLPNGKLQHFPLGITVEFKKNTVAVVQNEVPLMRLATGYNS